MIGHFRWQVSFYLERLRVRIMVGRNWTAHESHAYFRSTALNLLR